MPVRKAASYPDINTSDGFRSFWTLFDIAWITEAALIQLCVNSSSLRGSAKSAHPTQDDIHQIHITRLKVLGTIFDSPTMEAVAKDSIAAILLTPYCGVICNCLERLGAQPDHPARIPQPVYSTFIRRYADMKCSCRIPQAPNRDLWVTTSLRS